MIDPRSTATTALIAITVALGPLATDMYLPALPALTEHFATGIDRVQLTLSVFMAGFAIAQLIYGPLSDRFGRKPVILGGLLLFSVASFGCLMAQSIEQLIALRLLQAVGGCAGPVLGRAMVRDIYGPREAARVLALIGMAMALAPAVAPILGGYMTAWWGWVSIFAFLAAYGALLVLTLALCAPETVPAKNPHATRIGDLLANYRHILRHPGWRAHTLCCSLVFAGLFAFLSGSSFVLIGYLGYAEQTFGLFFAAVVAGYMLGALLSARLATRLGGDWLIARGSLLAALSGVCMAALALAGVHTAAAVVAPQVVYMTGVGMVMPAAMAGALAPFPRMAGAASALLGFAQMGTAALLGSLVGHSGDGSPQIMSLVIAASGCGTLLCYLRLLRGRQAMHAAASGGD